MKRPILNMIVVICLIFITFAQLHAGQKPTSDKMRLSTEDLRTWSLKGPSFMSKWTTGNAAIDPKNEERLIVTPSKNGATALINYKKGFADIMTNQVFGDCTLELEVMIPKASNSGIYLMGRYEVQIKDSHGKAHNVKTDDMGAVFGTSKPMVNAAGKPGEWQKFLIEFRAPRFEDGKRIEPAEFLKVLLNGEMVQQNVKMEIGPTKGALDDQEVPQGPLMLQGSVGPVAFRNIFITSN